MWGTNHFDKNMLELGMEITAYLRNQGPSNAQKTTFDVVGLLLVWNDIRSV